MTWWMWALVALFIAWLYGCSVMWFAGNMVEGPFDTKNRFLYWTMATLWPIPIAFWLVFGCWEWCYYKGRGL